MAADAAHVLVIDAAGDLRALFRDVLEDAGHRVSVVTRAPSVEEIARLGPDLILLDLVLGGDEEAAWRLAQELRRHERLAAVPLVVCSAATHVLRRLEAPLRALGAEVVPKPFELDDLLRAVERGLRQGGATT